MDRFSQETRLLIYGVKSHFQHYFSYIAAATTHIHVFQEFLNQLPDNKILDWAKLKQIADGIFPLHSIDTHFKASTTNSF